MNMKTSFTMLAITALVAIPLLGCTPEVGSEKWCANLKEKASADWSMSEAANYAKHCFIK